MIPDRTILLGTENSPKGSISGRSTTIRRFNLLQTEAHILNKIKRIIKMVKLGTIISMEETNRKG
jgi:hypothetical protein